MSLRSPAPAFSGGSGRLAAYSGRALACGVLLLAVAVNQSAVHWRENIADSHLFAYYGWRVLHGAAPYLDVWDNKPPGIWWLNALAMALPGDGPAGELAVCSLALTLTIAAVAGSAAAAYGRSILWVSLPTAALLLTQVQFECGANRTETFLAACESLAIFCFLGWRGGRAAGWLLAAGAAAGLAPWFKQSGLGALAACGAHLLVCGAGDPPPARTDSTARGTMRASAWFAAGVLAAQLPGLVALAWRGALAEAWVAVVQFNQAALTRSGGPAPLRTLAAHAGLWLAPLGAAFAWAALSAALRLANSRGRATLPRAAAGALFDLSAVWLLADLLLVGVSGGHEKYHYQPILPPLTLLMIDWLGRLLGGRSLAAAVSSRALLCVALTAYGFTLAGLLPAAAAGLRAGWQTKPAWWSLQRTAPAPYEAQAQVIRRVTAPDEAIYVWGWSPGTYRYALRPCPSRFATIEKAGHVGALARFMVEEAMDDVQRSPPKLFVISQQDFAGLTAEPRDGFAAWLMEHYREHSQVQGMKLLVRRDG